MRTWGEAIAGLTGISTDIHNTLKAILLRLGGEPGEPGEPPTPTNPIVSVYPLKNKKELAASGITIINTRKGEVVLDDDSVEYLSASIPDDPCRSILIDTDAQIDVTFLDGDKISLSTTIYPSKIRLHNLIFDTIKIKTTETATIQLFISNVEAPTIEDLLDTIVRPKGTIEEVGTGVTTNALAYVEILSYTPTTGKHFHLAKMKVPNLNAHYIRLSIGDTQYPSDISPDENTFIDWFPWDDGLLGDGTKTITVEAMAILAGETLYATIEGEED